MILGTGSNAAFLERADRVHHWEGERHGEKNVIIDIEWGAFGDKGTCELFSSSSTSKSRKRLPFSITLDITNEQSCINENNGSLNVYSFAGSIDFIRTEHDKEVDNGSLLKRSFT